MSKQLNDKYGDIDALTQPVETSRVSTRSRVKRPTPALGVMSGEQKTTRIVDSLKEEKKAVEDELKQAREAFEEEKIQLLAQLDMAKSKETPSSANIILTMPVTKQEISFELKSVAPSLIDVSVENERIQDFLDELSLKDILSSIKKQGQQKPGTLRPKSNGRYELIEGSRRLAAVKLAEKNYLALVGAVPDADVRELSVIENKHQDVSAFEKAKAYQRQIERGEYTSWTQLGAALGISSSHINRFKSCSELDDIFVRILPSPSHMPLSYGETISSLIKKERDELYRKAEELLGLRDAAINGGADCLDVDEILNLLKRAVRTKSQAPTVKKPVLYKSKSGHVSLKHSLSSKGTNKFEVSGLSEEKLSSLLQYLTKTLKVDQT